MASLLKAQCNACGHDLDLMCGHLMLCQQRLLDLRSVDLGAALQAGRRRGHDGVTAQGVPREKKTGIGVKSCSAKQSKRYSYGSPQSASAAVGSAIPKPRSNRRIGAPLADRRIFRCWTPSDLRTSGRPTLRVRARRTSAV